MKGRWRQVALMVGLVLLATSAITAVNTSLTLLFFVKAGLGAALLAVGLTAPGATRGVTAFYYSTSLGLLLALAAVLVLLNLLVERSAPTWDLSRNKVNTLSALTQQTLAALTTDVEVTLFVEGPPPERAEALLRRYAALQPRLTWSFHDPRREPELTARFQLKRGQPAVFLRAGERRTQVNLARLSDPRSGEQELTNGLLRLGQGGARRLAFVTGHGETPLEAAPGETAGGSLADLARLLREEGYELSALNLHTDEVPAGLDALVVVAPRVAFTTRERELLGRYLDQGGRVLFFAEGQQPSGLEPLLAAWGLALQPGLMTDPSREGGQPWVVTTPFLVEHELTRALLRERANLVLVTARAWATAPDRVGEVRVEPLLLASPQAWLETQLEGAPHLDPSEYSGQVPLVVVARKPVGEREGRLVGVADADLLGATLGYEPNRNFVLSLLGWTVGQRELVAIRPVDRDLSTLDLTPSRLGWVRVLGVDLLPTLFLVVGFAVWRLRMSR